MTTAGLGELLRYAAEAVDRGAEAHYRSLGLSYRPRYTPVMRALDAGATTVTEITALSVLTQPAVSQTVSKMLDDGIVERFALVDGRSSGLKLSGDGERLLDALRPVWNATFAAIADLEREIDHPVLAMLQGLTSALHAESFDVRVARAMADAS